MAISEMNYTGAGESGLKEITIPNDSTNHVIDVGHTFDRLTLFSMPNSSSVIMVSYDRNITSGFCWRALNDNGGNVQCGQLAFPQNNPLVTVDTTSFTVNINVSWMAGTWYYATD